MRRSPDQCPCCRPSQSLACLPVLDPCLPSPVFLLPASARCRVRHSAEKVLATEALHSSCGLVDRCSEVAIEFFGIVGETAHIGLCLVGLCLGPYPVKSLWTKSRFKRLTIGSNRSPVGDGVRFHFNVILHRPGVASKAHGLHATG